MEETAYAKINLALHVRGREADGYHRIETLFAFAEDGDRLRAEPADAIRLAVEGPFAEALTDGAENLVLRAAHAMAEQCDVDTGVALTLDKRLPVASGIGGGSADAAAALRLLARYWDLGLDESALVEIARGLGADVPACVASRNAVGTGRGDRLVPAEGVAPGTPLLLVNPGVAVATAEVFRGWTGEDGGPLPADWRDGRNDLEASARRLVPAIGDLLALLGAQDGARHVRMSGSGATCFALFESEARRDAAAARIAAARPGWWGLATRIR